MSAHILAAVVIALLLVAAFFALASRFGWGRVQRTPDEVARYLQQFLDGTGGDWDWDDFISVPIRNPQLERIRLRCSRLDEEFPPTEPNAYCSQQGRAVLESLLAEIRRGAA